MAQQLGGLWPWEVAQDCLLAQVHALIAAVWNLLHLQLENVRAAQPAVQLLRRPKQTASNWAQLLLQRFAVLAEAWRLRHFAPALEASRLCGQPERWQ